MNRRNFIGNILIAGASFAILPGAGRIWRAERKIINPCWVNAPYRLTFAEAMSCTQGMTTWEWFQFQMKCLNESRARTLRNWEIT